MIYRVVELTHKHLELIIILKVIRKPMHINLIINKYHGANKHKCDLNITTSFIAHLNIL